MTFVRLTALFSIIILSGLGLQSCSKKAGADRSLQSAKRFYAEGDFAAAEIELKNVFKADPRNIEAIRITPPLHPSPIPSTAPPSAPPQKQIPAA